MKIRYCKSYHENGILENPLFSQRSRMWEILDMVNIAQTLNVILSIPFVIGIISKTLAILPEIHIFVVFNFAKDPFTFNKWYIFHYEKGEILLWGKAYYIVRFPPGEKLLYSQFSGGGEATIGERLLYNTGSML